MNPLYGERPGFDPRMNEFPYTISFLDGDAEGRTLDVAGISSDILSVSRDVDHAFRVGLPARVGGSAITDYTDIEFSGTPSQVRPSSARSSG